ncbi:MAG: UMP kinase, partial [Myxococcales bacterium]|nr:UMP kinase [Myxococcales bacterium]
LVKNLRVMDQTALALCRENRMPVVVFDMEEAGNLRKLAAGKAVGTRVED